MYAIIKPQYGISGLRREAGLCSGSPISLLRSLAVEEIDLLCAKSAKTVKQVRSVSAHRVQGHALLTFRGGV